MKNKWIAFVMALMVMCLPATPVLFEDAQAAIQAQTPVNNYTGNSVTTTFPYTWKIFVNTDIKVTVAGVLKTLTTDYTVTGAGQEAGGNVVFVAAPASGTAIVIYRDLTYSRSTDYVEHGDFLASTVDDDIDRTVMLTQQLKEGENRALKLAVGSSLNPIVPILANKVIGWDTAGTALTTYPTTPVYSANFDTIQNYGNSLAAAVAVIGSAQKTLLIDIANSVTDNLVVPSNITLMYLQGAITTVSSGKTLTINGNIEAGWYKIFDGTGTVIINSPEPVKVNWWVTSGSGTASDPWLIANFEDPIKAAGSSYSTVLWASGDYKITSNTQIDTSSTRSFLHLKCVGDFACRIRSDNALATFFSFANDTGYSHELTIEGFHLDGQGTGGTTALLLIKHSYLINIKNCNIDNGAGVGLKIHAASTDVTPMGTAIEMENLQIRANDSHGIHLLTDSAITHKVGIFRIHGSGTIEFNGGYGIKLQKVGGGQLTSLRFESNTSGNISIDNCYDIDVFANTGYPVATANGIDVTNGSYGNRIYGNEMWGNWASKDAYYAITFDETTYENYYWGNDFYRGTTHSDMTTGSGNTTETYSGKAYIKVLDEGSNYNLDFNSTTVTTPENSGMYHNNRTTALTGETYYGNQLLKNYLTYSDIFPQKSLSFTSGGTYVTAVGNTIVGETSGATAKVVKVISTSGTFAAGTAAGTLLLVNQTGNFVAETIKVGANLDVATIAGNSSASNWIAQGTVTLTPDTSLVLPYGYTGTATKLEVADKAITWLYQDVAGVNLKAGETMTFSIFVKSDTGGGRLGTLELYLGSAANSNGKDPATGTDFRKVITDSKFIDSATVGTNNQPMMRHSVTWTAQADHTNVRIRVRPLYDSGSGYYSIIWGAQLNKGKVAPYISTDSSAITHYPGFMTNRLIANKGINGGFKDWGIIESNITLNHYEAKYHKINVQQNATITIGTTGVLAGDEMAIDYNIATGVTLTWSATIASGGNLNNTANQRHAAILYYDGSNWVVLSNPTNLN